MVENGEMEEGSKYQVEDRLLEFPDEVLCEVVQYLTVPQILGLVERHQENRDRIVYCVRTLDTERLGGIHSETQFLRRMFPYLSVVNGAFRIQSAEELGETSRWLRGPFKVDIEIPFNKEEFWKLPLTRISLYPRCEMSVQYLKSHGGSEELLESLIQYDPGSGDLFMIAYPHPLAVLFMKALPPGILTTLDLESLAGFLEDSPSGYEMLKVLSRQPITSMHIDHLTIDGELLISRSFYLLADFQGVSTIQTLTFSHEGTVRWKSDELETFLGEPIAEEKSYLSVTNLRDLELDPLSNFHALFRVFPNLTSVAVQNKRLSFFATEIDLQRILDYSIQYPSVSFQIVSSGISTLPGSRAPNIAGTYLNGARISP